MATPIFSRGINRRGQIAKPFSGVKRTRAKYKPRAGSGRRPSRGGLPTDAAAGRQLRSGRAADIAKSQIRSTGRATPETLGAALDAGQPRSAAERGEDRLSRRSAIQQSGKVMDSRGVPMTEAQRDQRGSYVASKQREKLENRRRQRSRIISPDEGSATFKIGDGPARTIRGGATRAQGLLTPQEAGERYDFSRGIRQDAFKNRFNGELANETNANMQNGMPMQQASRMAEDQVMPQYDQIAPDVATKMKTDYQIKPNIDPGGSTQQQIDSYRTGNRVQSRQAAGFGNDPTLQGAEQEKDQAMLGMPWVDPNRLIPTAPEYKSTIQSGFQPTQEGLAAANAPAPDPVAPPDLGPQAPGLTPMEADQAKQTDIAGQNAQVARLAEYNTALALSAQNGTPPPNPAMYGLSSPDGGPAGVEEPDSLPQLFGATPEEIAGKAQEVIDRNVIPDDIINKDWLYMEPEKAARRATKNLDDIERILDYSKNPADLKVLAKQMQKSPWYNELLSMSRPGPDGKPYKFISRSMFSLPSTVAEIARSEDVIRQKAVTLKKTIDAYAQ